MKTFPIAAPTPQPHPQSTVLRGCHRVTAYRAGFEDLRYDREYKNPFTPGKQEWMDYDNGIVDAVAEKQVSQ